MHWDANRICIRSLPIFWAQKGKIYEERRKTDGWQTEEGPEAAAPELRLRVPCRQEVVRRRSVLRGEPIALSAPLLARTYAELLLVGKAPAAAILGLRLLVLLRFASHRFSSFLHRFSPFGPKRWEANEYRCDLHPNARSILFFFSQAVAGIFQ